MTYDLRTTTTTKIITTQRQLMKKSVCSSRRVQAEFVLCGIFEKPFDFCVNLYFIWLALHLEDSSEMRKFGRLKVQRTPRFDRIHTHDGNFFDIMWWVFDHLSFTYLHIWDLHVNLSFLPKFCLFRLLYLKICRCGTIEISR